jgi:hypothetical protein
MTTNEFVASVKALGFRTRGNKTYGVNFIDIQNKDGDTIANVDVDIQGKMSVRRITEGYDHNTLFQVMCAYASTPVSERESNMYKLKILDTNLYLIYINKHKATVTTNKEAAKAYDDVETYEAKVLADKQGFALRAEVINVDD